MGLPFLLPFTDKVWDQYVQDAILREKRMKKWKRQWKINQIEEDNPKWKDLAEDWYD